MSLEDILKIAKEDLWDRPDEWVRSQYQKIGKRIPEGKLYHVTSALSIGSVFSSGSIIYLTEQLNNEIISEHMPLNSSLIVAAALNGTLLGLIIGPDAVYNTKGLTGLFTENYSDETRAINCLQEVGHEQIRIARFPVFLGGAMVSLCSMYEGASDLFEGKSPSAIVYSALFGVSIFLLGNASSMYLKDRDPKQFKKDPFWKRAYDYASGKVQEMFPEPVPAPVRTYSAL